MRSRPAAAAILALLAVPALPSLDAGAGAGRIEPFEVVADGEVATGLVAIPAAGTSTALVVLCHGWGQSASLWLPELQDLADRGYLAVAMEYRGPVQAWKVFNGTADTIAAARALRAAHPEIQRTIAWGFSMGGQISGMAIMRTRGLFDYWVDSDGAVNWAETFPINPIHIAAEAGGPPWRVPQVYRDNAPALNDTGFLGSGLRRAYVMQGAVDPQVTLDQQQQVTLNLRRQGVPVSAYVVTTGPRPELPAPLPLPAAHWRWGYAIVLAKAAGREDPPEPLVEGVHDASLGVYVPPV